MRIEGRTFVVSGGASGLGRATCSAIAKAGGYVAVLDVDEDSSTEIVSEFGREKARFFRVDVSRTESITSATKNVLAWAKSNGKDIGGIVAAAGIGKPAKMVNSKGELFSLEEFDHVMSVNVRGTVDLCRQFLPQIISVTPPDGDHGERGVLVLVSSIAAFDGQPGQVTYSASKGAIVSLTLPLARELAVHGIRVVTIAPGVFATGMTGKLGSEVTTSLQKAMEWPTRAGKPEEFSRLVLEILSNEMLNGTVIRLDGGMRMPSKM
ncbi:hypothetical protein LTR54_017330 [Friedmanniomyces endolithicus]|nr:hypothetical protein LTR54_017330 [Friedmanniomyces endolithicus]